MKTCPFCAERIQDTAVKCRFCGSMLPGAETAPPPVAPSAFRGVPCPKCGSRQQRTGPWPWYLGTVGTMLVQPVICMECGHHFDTKKPHADLAARKRNLALAINGIGLLGIVLIIGALVLFAVSLSR